MGRETTLYAVVIFAIGVSLVTAAVDPCPPGFVNLGVDPNINCLMFTTSYGSWKSMKSFCELAGGTMAKVTGDLHNTVYQYIRDRPAFMDKCFWIGGTDERMEGQWRWVIDDSSIPLGGPHWDPCETEPNGGLKENYMAICPDRYYFKDYPNERNHHVICQIII